MTKQTTKPRKPYQRKPKLKDGGLVTKPDGSIDPKSEMIEPVEKFVIKPEYRYEKHILNLQTMQGFYDEWISRFAYSKTNEDAYESTEIFFEAYFGRRRFKNYESFASSVSQWLKKRNEKPEKNTQALR
jgi:hypothetical protein